MRLPALSYTPTTPCPKTMTGTHYFENSGDMIGRKYIDKCKFCGIYDDREEKDEK